MTSLCKNLFNLLEFLEEAFRCQADHFQCLMVPVPPDPSSIENDTHGIKKLLLNKLIQHIIVQDQDGQNNNKFLLTFSSLPYGKMFLLPPNFVCIWNLKLKIKCYLMKVMNHSVHYDTKAVLSPFSLMLVQKLRRYWAQLMIFCQSSQHINWMSITLTDLCGLCSTLRGQT